MKKYLDFENLDFFLSNLDDRYCTKSDVDTRIQGVVGAAPEALDTLAEIATALNNNADFAGTMTTELAKKANTADFVEMSNTDIQKLWDSVSV